MKNNVYIIFAADTDCTTDAYDLNAYAAANSYILAKKIAQKDEAAGQILAGWHIQEMFLSTSEEDV